jgi:FkbM family methyltransferase
MSFEKLKSAITLVFAAMRAPGAALYAVRERGLRHVVRRFAQSDPVAAQALATDVRARAAPATLENLHAYYREFRFSPADPGHVLVELPTGERFYVRIARGWYDVGTLHDTFVKQIYRDHPPLAGARVLDIGANIGDTAVYFGARGAHVIAYEPDPEMFALAQRNVALNRVDAEIRNAGVGATSGAMRLSAAAGGADSMSTTLFPGSAPANRLHVRTIDVDVVGFADVLAQCGLLRLVKFDCEGCEYPALTSLPDESLAEVEHIIMEHHGQVDVLTRTLRRLGFSVRAGDGPYVYAQRRSTLEGPVRGSPE